MALYIGVMSGTSMDAVDAALVDFTAGGPRLRASLSSDWPPTLRERLVTLAAGAPVDASSLAALDHEAGEFFATCINRLLTDNMVDADRVIAIGSHGQTVAHQVDDRRRATLQVGDPNVIAERTGITTVADFRRRDIAAGGQGAPLAPAFHAAVMQDPSEDRVVLNLGGIANLTVLSADSRRPGVGFDIGPANCLMDAWCRQQLGEPFDEAGRWAASAAPDQDLLAAMLADPYFSLVPPKSTGTQYFSPAWLRKRLAASPTLDPARVQATLLALTARSVGDAIRAHAPTAARVLVCGGGVLNRALMDALADTLQVPVQSTAEHGVDPQWMEAMAFAWLAQRTLEGLPGNLPSVTGADGPRVLGSIHPA